jgi:hypothetical protein
MPFNIAAFKSHVEKTGHLKNNQFEVFVQLPLIFQNTSLNNNGVSANLKTIGDSLRYRVEQVRAPGINLLSSEINRYGIGPTQKMPHSAQFNEITLSILVDGSAELWQFWYNWIRSVFEFNGNESSRVGQANRIPTYTTEYKENYSSIVMIVIYDNFGNTIQRINLFEAFPTAIREIPLFWGDSQNLMKLSVSLSFSEYTIVGTTLEKNFVPQRSNLTNAAQVASTQSFL